MMRGYDNYFNIVLDDATVVEKPEKNSDRKVSKVESMLLNGHEIVFVIVELFRWCLEHGLIISYERIWNCDV